MWVALTSHAGQELTSKRLDLAVWEGHKVVALEEVEHALAEEIHDDANVTPVIEAVPEVDATVPVLLVVDSERLEDAELDLARLAVLLHRPNDLDGDELVLDLVLCLHDLAKRSLAEQLDHSV